MPDESPVIRPGDVVTLRSGGPRMTVLDVGRFTDVVWCRWEKWEPVAGELDGVLKFVGHRDKMVPAPALVKEEPAQTTPPRGPDPAPHTLPRTRLG